MGRKPWKPSETDLRFADACDLMILGRSAHDSRIPVGVAHGSVERFVRAGLLDHDWPLTKLSLRVAQMRSELREKAAAERLWTEENR